MRSFFTQKSLSFLGNQVVLQKQYKGLFSRADTVQSHIHLPEKLPSKGITRIRGEFPSEVLNLIEYMKSKKEYVKMGAQFPTGLLLVGPPGTGKTLVGRSIAQEVGIPFKYIAASDFSARFTGEAEERIRVFFAEARELAAQNEYAIAFIDELDAMGSREENMGMAYRQAMTTLLTQMDGYDKGNQEESSLYVFGATNQAAAIDKALLRPGRFDRIVKIPLPNKSSRKDILKYYASAIRYDKTNIDFDCLAQKTNQCSPAELNYLVNESALCAVRQKDDCVTMKHFFDSFDNLKERRSLEKRDDLKGPQ